MKTLVLCAATATREIPLEWLWKGLKRRNVPVAAYNYMFPSFDSLGGEIVVIGEKALKNVLNENPCLMSSYWNRRNKIGKGIGGTDR